MQQATPMNRQAGLEPIAGYRLIEPLGQGGFGEVWKCEAPGGVFKAIKFVGPSDGGASPASQELESLQRVKTLRHPFILSLDRLEVVDDVLLIIMELADYSLHELYGHYRESGQTGLPRDELLGYLVEGAEALDWMNFEHHLQHLDIKPHNLFLVSNHVKVADFGLVSSLGEENSQVRQGGVTPLYSAPELLRGSLSRHSDQYSLAVVYQQLLTGTVPFWHDNIYELMMLHLSAAPDLAALPEQDRPIVERALAKIPEQRYPSCLEFVHALLGGGQGKSKLRQSGAWRRVIVGKRDEGKAASPSSAAQATPRHESQTPRTPVPPADQGPQSTTPVVSPVVSPSNKWEETRRLDTPPAPPDKNPNRAPANGVPQDAPRRSTGPMPNIVPLSVQGPAPTAVTLPGYRFLSCIQQGPLGEVWRAEDADGRPRRALCALNFVRYDARLIAHLQALRDPALPATEVHWSPAERLVLLTECFEQTLRELWEGRRSEGRPGLNRADLLQLLLTAAESLDALYARHGLQHLGINPRNLLVDGERLWVAEFGVIPLLWLPTGQPAAMLNSRYAAPELFTRRPSRTADQYSLALIYAEMLTGVHPRPQRPTGNSGAHRRTRATAPPRAARLELDLVPAHDREVLLKALSDNPEDRYESCTAFIEALEQAGRELKNNQLFHSLPPVIPYASLMGEPPRPGTVLPAVAQLVVDLTTPPDPRKIHGPQNARYLVHPEGTWEYRFPLQLFPGAMALKVEGFREYWKAHLVGQDGDLFQLHIDLESPRGGFWDRGVKSSRRLEVDIRVEPAAGSQVRLTEATMQVRCTGSESEQKARILSRMAPEIFDSVRVYFQASQEQRTRDRLPLMQPVRVYPVLPDLELGEVIEGRCQNISFGGIRMQLPKQPETDDLYLHLYEAPAALGYAILAQVMRVQELADGFEIGARFGG